MPNRCIALGFFDGVHIGHRKLIETAVSCGEGMLKTIFSFENHPLSLLSPEKTPPYLTSLQEKETIFRECGIDEVIFVPFDLDMARMTPEDFLNNGLVDELTDHETLLERLSVQAGVEDSRDLALIPFPDYVGAKILPQLKAKKNIDILLLEVL